MHMYAHAHSSGVKSLEEFANLGEIRSLIPSNIQLMALTATATKQSRQVICHTLGMKKPVVVSQSPNKPNIFYELHSKSGSLEEALAPLVEELRRERNLMDHVLIFCQKYDDVTHIYHFSSVDSAKKLYIQLGLQILSGSVWLTCILHVHTLQSRMLLWPPSQVQIHP